uniref:Uncharacterized protein n=1 Tax=Timema genevievae TaxID=629358 RepID=A0A7R9JSP0_TIMGE|nr:unnamed protein product [Timema genevievae]
MYLTEPSIQLNSMWIHAAYEGCHETSTFSKISSSIVLTISKLLSTRGGEKVLCMVFDQAHTNHVTYLTHIMDHFFKIPSIETYASCYVVT